MGLGTGATVAELGEGLRPLILQCQPGLSSGEAEEIATIVVEALLNERERRQAFREPYLAVEADGATRRHIPFHLLREHALPDGSIVLKATTEAINLYAGMLEYPVEDDLEALDTLPNKFRLRNAHRDRATGDQHVTLDGAIEAVRVLERAAP